jgi:TolB-like protein
VISRITVKAFKNHDKPVPEIAREIQVDCLVEASVLVFEAVRLDPAEPIE